MTLYHILEVPCSHPGPQPAIPNFHVIFLSQDSGGTHYRIFDRIYTTECMINRIYKDHKAHAVSVVSRTTVCIN